MCEIEGCERPINRSGLCFPHKMKTVGFNLKHLHADVQGDNVQGDIGTTEYVKNMYENRRAAGMADPEPANAEAAKYAPAIGTRGGKKYREANGGL